MERYTDSQTWIVVFDQSHGPRRWWHYLMKKEFRHVHLLRDNRGYCLMVNCFQHCMAIKEYPNTLEDIVTQELAQNPTAMLQITVHYGAYYKELPKETLTCVSITKRLLGIHARWVKSPLQLYHELIKAGATIIKPFTVTR